MSRVSSTLVNLGHLPTSWSFVFWGGNVRRLSICVVVSISFNVHPFFGKWSNLTNVFQMGWLIHVTTDGVWGFFLLVNSFSHQPFNTSLFWRLVWSYMSTTKPLFFFVAVLYLPVHEQNGAIWKFNESWSSSRDRITETENGHMEPKYLAFWRWLHTPIFIWQGDWIPWEVYVSLSV